MTHSQVGQTLAVLLLGICLAPGSAQAVDCANLPTSFSGGEFPTGDFFTNFNNPCYTIPLASGNGASQYGDLNATYFQMYYRAIPGYELVLVGTYPNARYFSVTLYDEHSALSQSMVDANIVPLTSQYINPFQPGVPYAAGQQFALPIYFGGTPGSWETGCQMNGYNVRVNGLNATRRHPGMDWNDDPGFLLQYPKVGNHNVDNADHTNPNTAGVVMIRVYLDGTPLTAANSPQIIVRDVASGCAYPAVYAVKTLEIVTNDRDKGSSWLDQSQFDGHHIYETNYLPKLCDAPITPPNRLPWSRVGEYIPATNPDAAYITAPVPSGLPDTLAAAGEVLRIRVRVPTTPPTPCSNGCSMSGTEQMRYMSLSFQEAGGLVLASVADNALTKDANGYATLIVGTGASIPSWITPANGYTFLDLTALPKYQQLSLLAMRHMIPGSGFNCAGQYVPYRWTADTPGGSLMSDFMPVADYPLAANLPTKATALVGPSTCNVFPVGEPGIRGACAVLPNPAPAITGVVTECPAPGCQDFTTQANPPITITGQGFGAFPTGIPFHGLSNYLRLTNTTQNWVAAYTGSACEALITSWDTGMIQLRAHLNQDGLCPLAAKDNLLVEVWNPQTMVEAVTSVTVVNPPQ